MTSEKKWIENLEKAASLLKEADALLIGAGAGMGMDSGLPDFRSTGGLWRKKRSIFWLWGRSYASMSNPGWFRKKPRESWGFYGSRLLEYRAKEPHKGFQILRNWAEERGLDTFVFTSNVDEHFQKAGFSPEQILECHGSLHYVQCSTPCHDGIWSIKNFDFQIDPKTEMVKGDLPTCPKCGKPARPNLLLFGDPDWLEERMLKQRAQFEAWQERIQGKRLVVVECGAGTAVPTVRMRCEDFFCLEAPNLVRINPNDIQGPFGGIFLDRGALESLQAIDRLVSPSRI